MTNFVYFPNPVISSASTHDMLIGPCSCGAWHTIENWEIRFNEESNIDFTTNAITVNNTEGKPVDKCLCGSKNLVSFHVGNNSTYVCLDCNKKNLYHKELYELINMGIDRNIVVYDGDAHCGQVTKRLIMLMSTISRRNGISLKKIIFPDSARESILELFSDSFRICGVSLEKNEYIGMTCYGKEIEFADELFDMLGHLTRNKGNLAPRDEGLCIGVCVDEFGNKTCILGSF